MDEAFGAFDAFGRADLVKRGVERFGGFGGETDDEIEAARGCVDRFDIGQGLEPHEHGRGAARFDREQGCGTDGRAGARAFANGIARDHASAFEPFDARLHGGAGEAERGGEAADGRAGVFCEQGEEVAVFFVECHEGIGSMSEITFILHKLTHQSELLLRDNGENGKGEAIAMFQPVKHESATAHMAAEQPLEPQMYFSPEILRCEAARFLDGFDGEVTYAVKANPAPEVLANLVAAGLRGFDVASPEEIRLVRAASAEAALHYNNPVRSADEVAAGKAAGVLSWSVDELGELEKLGAPAFAGEEVAVRLKLPVKGAHYDFGAKFGATPEAAAALLRHASERGYAPSICFHTGTQCDVPEAWASYIATAADVARVAGVRLGRLNVGGGFAAHRGGARPDLEAIFAAIHAAVAAHFDAPPALVCEPGRAMVAESFALLVRVKALRDGGAVFINDGIYGGFAEWRDICPSTRVEAYAPSGAARRGALEKRAVFGPTCDSLDRLPEPLGLPRDLAEGDYLLFQGMGAYSLAIATRFNGYGPRGAVTVRRLY